MFFRKERIIAYQVRVHPSWYQEHCRRCAQCVRYHGKCGDGYYHVMCKVNRCVRDQ